MPPRFIAADRDQQLLMPPSLADWLPEDHLAWFILDAVAALELAPFLARYRADGRGRAAYDPQTMLALTLYAYCVGERSSRAIERRCAEDVAFRVICANQRPDHATIARFRARHQAELAGLFGQVLALCADAGMVRVGVVAIDGTRMGANAARRANLDRERIEREARRILAEAAEADAVEDARYGSARGDELPAELSRRPGRAERLREAARRLDEREAERLARHEAHLERRRETVRVTGKGIRGRRPVRPAPDPQAAVNLTDPDSRLQKIPGGYLQGYNGQLAVSADQIILACALTANAADVTQLQPMLGAARTAAAALRPTRTIGAVVADAGYLSEANLIPDPKGPELLIATRSGRRGRQAEPEPAPRGRIPTRLSARQRMERKLATKRGRALYRLRAQTVEPVFGQIKEPRGIRRFMRRGLAACQSEWALIALTHNLLKLYRHGARAAPARRPAPAPA